jgi:hypothetical protein
LKNIEMSVQGSTLTIKVDLSKSFGRSKSGKTTIIASTEGASAVPSSPDTSIRVGLNVYK